MARYDGTENLRPVQSEEEARALGQKGGIASGKARREKKTLADALRKVLDEPINSETKLTRREAIALNVIRRLYDEGDIRDVKVLSEILGELTQKVDIENLPTIIQVSSEETKDKLTAILKDNADD